MIKFSNLLFILILTLATSSFSQVVDHLEDWPLVYLIRSNNGKIECYAIKSMPMDEKREAEFLKAMETMAVGAQTCWIYAKKIKGNEVTQTRTIQITEQEAKRIINILSGFSLKIEDLNVD